MKTKEEILNAVETLDKSMKQAIGAGDASVEEAMCVSAVKSALLWATGETVGSEPAELFTHMLQEMEHNLKLAVN